MRRERIAALQKSMKERGIDGYVITGDSPHLCKEEPRSRRVHPWISGFTGSKGILFITGKRADFLVDFRYHIQADRELDRTGIIIQKENQLTPSSLVVFMREILENRGTIGIDGRTLSEEDYRELGSALEPRGMTLRGDIDLITPLWRDRPPQTRGPVWELEERYSGKSRTQKISEIRAYVREERANHHFIATLDDIAWVLNIRGEDLPASKVVLGYLLISPENVEWFVERDRIPSELMEKMKSEGISTRPYGEVEEACREVTERGEKVLLDATTVNHHLFALFPPSRRKEQQISPARRMKACKNATEIVQTKSVMERDGVALVRLLKWLEETVGKEEMTELSVKEKMLAMREREEGFLGNSFSPIIAYGEHGALCHYCVDERTNAAIHPGSSILLIDSGGQYRTGTTDITRTLTLGEPTTQQIRDYTLVLKGHIDLSMMRFPEGTRGYQLDVIARAPLWNERLNYGHGTGHGVGCLLDVHEGPQLITPAPVNIPLKEGMITSNEPGIYREGEYGIRIENLLLCVKGGEDFLGFETLTLCPYEMRLIDWNLLSSQEIKWLVKYHQEVFARLSVHLDTEERRWLKEKITLPAL